MSDPQGDPPRAGELTHIDRRGHARMVDVSQKSSTLRRAIARAVVVLTPEVRAALLEGRLPKGEALAVARVAGIQAAKHTSQLIPLCHPLTLTSVELSLEPLRDDCIEVRSEVCCVGPTGAEMEALAAASIAALTLYDMCKSLHRGIRITDLELLHKSGGRSGTWTRDDAAGARG